MNELGGTADIDPTNAAALVRAMEHAPVVAVGVEAGPLDPFSPPAPDPSARFGAPCGPPDASLPAVVVSVAPGRARDALFAAIERGAARGLILQATLASWGDAPSLAMTPYEKAVGIEGKDVTRESWVTRYLRVVGDDTVWLGPPIAARLPEDAKAGLQSAAARCGELPRGGLSVTVGGRARRSSVEQALRALLPSAADFSAYRKGIRR
jgi:hypothetical protein